MHEINVVNLGGALAWQRKKVNLATKEIMELLRAHPSVCSGLPWGWCMFQNEGIVLAPWWEVIPTFQMILKRSGSSVKMTKKEPTQITLFPTPLFALELNNDCAYNANLPFAWNFHGLWNKQKLHIVVGRVLFRAVLSRPWKTWKAPRCGSGSHVNCH